ncbi:hypothetical protein ARMSODRAFT_184204 [Armillaria solidipes]|uniref:Uncharacterized protein n=1 Tax=Armillaria solidipes TaxID=1076256 RepID=A0A2H3AGY9_9AGAR|nr:hypothetical protein ARMSODRAFT_184204 [Armillaria solidipes]
MMHDVSLSQMPYSSSFSQNGFHRTNNKMFILRFYARPLTGPERTENLSMLHLSISLTPSHPLINPLSGLRSHVLISILFLTAG